MPHHDFVFSVNVADEGRFDEMLTVLAHALVNYAGCSGDEAGRILEGLHHALVEGAAAGLHQCSIEFRATGHELQVAVCYSGGREWRATHAVP